MSRRDSFEIAIKELKALLKRLEKGVFMPHKETKDCFKTIIILLTTNVIVSVFDERAAANNVKIPCDDNSKRFSLLPHVGQ